MATWKLKNISDSYTKTKEFRFNNYVVNPHVKNIVGSVKGKNLLEIGCGFGRYIEIFSKDTPLKIVGCDISGHQIELCKKNVKNSNIKYYVLDFLDSHSPLLIGQDDYDIVYNVFLVLYIDNLNKMKTFIENCYKCLKKGGKFLTCTLDIAKASAYPEVFEILNFPTKPLTADNNYVDGRPIEITITEDCVVTSYHTEFNTFKHLMENVGFKNVKKYELFLDEIALQAFNEHELGIIKNSDILLLIEAYK